MKQIFNIMILMTALTLAWGCSSDDENKDKFSEFTPSGKQDWKVDLTADDPVSEWTAPDPSRYESSIFIRIRLEDELARHSSDDDIVTVFIDDECRAYSNARNVNDNGGIYYILKIHANSSYVQTNISLRYYCASLHQVFSISGRNTFASGHTYGFDEDYVPPLLSGSSKYPVQGELNVILPQELPFTATANDAVAVFAGNECRGTGVVGKPFTVFGRQEGETLQIRYYSAEKGGVYILSNMLKTSVQAQTCNIVF